MNHVLWSETLIPSARLMVEGGFVGTLSKETTRPLVSAGVLIGIGMGGFVDGILFHQIFQIHNMLSARIPPTSVVNIETNMVWDGLFHALTWLMTAFGIFLLWQAGKQRDVPWSGRTFVGSLFAGWGVFNLVEGIVDHHILGLHH